MQAAGGSGGEERGGVATYRGLRRRAPLSAMGDINVTPLVDVVLVLLLVFMVTAPMMSRGIDVTLPTADQPQISPEDRITVAIDVEGRTYLAGQPLHILLLEDRVRAMMAGRSSKVVYLQADERLKYGKVIEVVDKLKKAGVDQIGFVYTLPKGRT